MKKRILFGGLYHETHTFLPQETRWADFQVTTGAAIFGKEGDESPTAGFLGEARRVGWEVVPTIDARAMPGGPVGDATFEQFWSEFEARARPALAVGVDAIFLVLHGAMATPTYEDAEGEFLARLRALPGAAGKPLFGVLDLHGNITARFCAHANCLVAYRKNPHTDAKDTAVHTTQLLDRCLATGRVPRTHWCRVPVVWAPPGTGTQDEPMRPLLEWARRTEESDTAVWAVNVMAGFSFADTADTGVSLSIVADGDPASHLRKGARLAWELRERGAVQYPDVNEIVSRLGPGPRGPVLLVEPADNIGGGAPGDGTGVLRALLAHRVARGLVAINDPQAVARLGEVPVGGGLRLPVGGRGWALDAGPVELDLTLVSRSDGRFQLEDPHSHLASMSGLQADMGSCAVVRHAGVTILLTSRKTPPFDLGQFRSQGIEPREFSYIGVKAAVAHRQAYDPIAAESHWVDTPGPCSSNLARFPYRRLRRPVYPLDAITEPEFLFS